MKQFLILYYLLDVCYFRDPEDNLAMLLSPLSPEMFLGGMPIDPILYTDWKREYPHTWHTQEEVVDAANSFLDFYKKHFNYHFEKAKKTLSEITPEMFEEAQELAKKTWEENQYDENSEEVRAFLDAAEGK